MQWNNWKWHETKKAIGKTKYDNSWVDVAYGSGWNSGSPWYLPQN